VARRHADYYRDLLERAEAEAETLPAPAWLAVYGHQIGQVRAALDWAFSPTGFAELGVALTVAAADTSDLVPDAALPLALYCERSASREAALAAVNDNELTWKIIYTSPA
jgi:predicted ATPase